MQITTCKKSTKSLNPQLASDLLHQRTLGMLDHTQLKLHDNTVTLINMQPYTTDKHKNSTLSQDIGTLLFWRTLGMSRHV